MLLGVLVGRRFGAVALGKGPRGSGGGEVGEGGGASDIRTKSGLRTGNVIVFFHIY